MRTVRASVLTLLAFVASIPVQGRAEQITVTPSAALEVRFSVTLPLKTFTDRGPFEQGLFYPDMVFFDMSPVTLRGGIGEHSVYLFDGDTLLGVVTNNLVGNSYIEMGTFMSADSLFFAGPNRQTIIDMSSILDGTIDGRLVFTISRGSVVVDDADIRGTLGLGYYGTFAVGDSLNILSVRTVRIRP